MGVKRGKQRRAAKPTAPATDAAPGTAEPIARKRQCDAPADASFTAVYDAKVLDAIVAHCDSTHRAEVGGVLLGRVCRDEAGAYLLVDGHVPALAATGAASHVTFTADAWALIHATLDRDHPGATIVGWYHSHPGFGVFLSDMDTFIQRHFFDLPWQVALVVDPVGRDIGTFVWRDDEPTRTPHGVEGASVTPIVRPNALPATLLSIAVAYLLLWVLTMR